MLKYLWGGDIMVRLQDKGTGPRKRICARPIHKLAVSLAASTIITTAGCAGNNGSVRDYSGQDSYSHVRRADQKEYEIDEKTNEGLLQLFKLANMPTISLEKLLRLDRESEPYRIGDVEDPIYYQSMLMTELPDNQGKIGVVARLCSAPGCNGNENIPDKAVMISTKDNLVSSVMDLTALEKYYKKATGEELKYVKLLVEKGTNEKVGEYVEIFVVPVDKPNGDIKPGVPIMSEAYAAGKMYEQPQKLVAMR